MSRLPQSPSTDLTTFSIELDGNALPSSFQVEYIDIRRTANHIASAEIAFIDGDSANRQFAASEAKQLIPGAAVNIKLGYNSSDTSVFKGVLIRQQLKIKRGGQSQLIVFCKDAAFAMAQSCQSRHFAESTDSEAIEQIARDYGLQADIQNSSVQHLEIVQYRQLDWDFIVQHAERCGFYCATDDGVLRVQPPADSTTALDLIYGQNIIDLDLQMDAREQYSETKSRGWSVTDQQANEQDGVPASFSSLGNISQSTLADAAGSQTLQLAADGSVSVQVLQAWSDAAKSRQALAKVVGVVTIQGIAGLKIGDWVQLEGVGDKFNGTAWVGGIVHAVSRGNWLTSIQLGMPAHWHTTSPEDPAIPLKTLETTVSGLLIGKVVQLQDDPDDEQRIRVTLPTMGNGLEGIWTRVASLDAGDKRGWVSLPEIGDEVVVGFLDNDARQPVLLGSLHSSSNPAPIQAADDNHEKGWVTRSGMQLTFDDDKVNLNIETPAGNQILLSEDDGAVKIQDQNNNIWLMDSNGVTLTSDNTIKIESQGEIQLKGIDVSIEASASLTLKGGSGANLESSGNTVVKGSLVQIN